MSKPDKERVAVLIPCLDEESTIESVVQAFKKALPHASVYVFDNNSDDSSAEIARSAGAFVYNVPCRGKGNVVREMFRTVDSDIYVLVDGDGTYFAEDSIVMIAAAISKNLDMVVGDRLSNNIYDQQNKRRFHSFGNRFVRNLINFIYKADCKDILSGYRVFTRRFVDNCPIISDGFEVETEITIHAIDKKFGYCEIPIRYQDRPAGSVSKLSTISDGVRIIKTIALLFKDYKPLRFFSAVALVVAVAGFGVGSYPIIEYFKTGYVDRVPLAFLAASLEVVAVLLYCCGLILDTVVRANRERCEMNIAAFNKSTISPDE